MKASARAFPGETSNPTSDSRARRRVFVPRARVLLVCALLQCGVLRVPAAFADGPLDLSAPGAHDAYVERLRAESQARKAEAVAWALQHGMPIRQEDGQRVREIMAVCDGRPLYYVTNNVEAAVSIGADRIRDLSPWDLDGEGFIVGIWDGASVSADHPEFLDAQGLSRVTAREAAEIAAHATHVAGTIAARGVDPAAKGMAPRARIESYNWDDDTAKMSWWAADAPGQTDKIYVSNHSYGFLAGWVYSESEEYPEYNGWYWYNPVWDGPMSREEWFGLYHEVSRQWDDVAYHHPYYLAFTSAGNDRSDNPEPGDPVFYWTWSGWSSTTYDPSTCPPGDGEARGGYGTVSGSGVAKNVMTVGAVDDAILDGTRGLSRAAMTDFSSWGPTLDGRIKPDIVATGVDVYSSCYDEEEGTNTYESREGTSMACPTATGAAVLLVQYYDRLFPGDSMRASTLKGLIIHTADDLGRPGPDYQFGWGLMNATAAAELLQDHHYAPEGKLLIEGKLDESDPVDEYYAFVSDDAPIRVTLCWTDPPGDDEDSYDHAAVSRLKNDLDLRVIGPDGSTYRPYALDPFIPAKIAAVGDNRRDNVEQIYIPKPPEPGMYTIRITHKAQLTHEEQHYSLISSEPLFDHHPPTAEDTRIYTTSDAAVTIALSATDNGLPDPPGRLTYIITALPGHGTLEYPNGVAISETGPLANYAGEVVYLPDDDFDGDDHFTFCADDGGAGPTDGISNAATVTVAVRDGTTVEYQVSASGDDTHSQAASEYASPISTHLFLGRASSGMRFTDMEIPHGSEIIRAHLKICLEPTVVEYPIAGLLCAEAIGNAESFSGSGRRPYKLRKTNRKVAWNWQAGTDLTTDIVSDGPVDGAWRSSPDVREVVQEIIDRPDWSAGNAMAILYLGDMGNEQHMRFYSFDMYRGYAAKLEIAFAPPVGDRPVPTAPASSVLGDRPPSADDMMVFIRPKRAATFELVATDDGQPDPPGKLTYTVASLPQHGQLNSRGQFLTEPTTLANFGSQLTYFPDQDFVGRDTFTFYADDGGSAPDGGASGTVTVTLMVMNTGSCELEIETSADDACIGNSGRNQNSQSNPLYVGLHTSVLRFARVNIPPESEILEARLQISAATPEIKCPIDGILHGEAAGDAANFLAANGNILERPRTRAAVPWAWGPEDSVPLHTYCSSPNLTEIVQEIVDRPDWEEGNALVLIYSSRVYHGQELEFASRESLGQRQARLNITYALDTGRAPVSPPEVSQQAPVARSATVATLWNSPATIVLNASDDHLPDPPGGLTYALLSLPAHGELTKADGQPVGLYELIGADDNELLYRPLPTFMGQDQFMFHALDGIESLSGRMSNPATITLEVPSTVTREFQVLADEDDAYASDSDQTTLSEFLRVGRHSSGMRFRNVDIPPGSEILSASLKVSVGSGNLAGPVAGAVQAEAALYPPDFTEANPGLYDRLVTDAFVPWTWQAQTFAPKGWYASDDLGAVVQEIVDQPGWLPGNPIAILYSGDTQNSRDIEFFGCAHPNFDRAAKIQITFDPKGVSALDFAQSPPIAENITAETPFNTPVTIALAATDDGLPDPPGKLSYAIASLPDHGTLEHPDGTAITGSGALPAYKNEVVYWPDPDFGGQDNFTFHADDGGTAPPGGASNTATVTITVRPAPANTMTAEYQVISGPADAHARPQTAFNKLFEELLYVGWYSSGMRFENIDIPRGSNILNAHLKICLRQRPFEHDVDGFLCAEATGNAIGFSGTNRNICHLPRTEATVSWSWTVQDYLNQYWEAYIHNNKEFIWSWCSSPDIRSVVQEIIDRPDWVTGNAIAIIYASSDYQEQNLAFGSRDHAVFPEHAPKLEVTYAY
ncbi:MAG: S8 family serine peptidase [Sedimentisphaerales bacterium]|nr:S8 family serine peptidase [Sedimentisphaerales bacterium]